MAYWGAAVRIHLIVRISRFAPDLQARAVDQEMQGLFTANRLWQDGQTATPAAQCRVIGDSNIELKPTRDRSQQASGWWNTRRSAILVSMAIGE
jgi:hypothetical protein